LQNRQHGVGTLADGRAQFFFGPAHQDPHARILRSLHEPPDHRLAGVDRYDDEPGASAVKRPPYLRVARGQFPGSPRQP